jgi:hypothetical protein
MKRYQEELTVDRSKNIPYFEPTIPSKTPVEEVPFYYTTRGNERLDNLSTLFYKTPSNWWVIAKANNLANGTVSVPDGTRLYIPKI